MLPLTVAISPCPNDSFIFGAWVLGLIPHSHEQDARFHWHDVQELNQAAFSGTWDIIKVSAAAALRLQDRYAILTCGGAFGLEHGPKLVTREGFHGSPDRIAVPGMDTTAMCLLHAALEGRFTPVPMIFHAIVDAVRNGEVDGGLLIHETALIHDKYGLELALDLGRWWHERTRGLPLPLGCIIARGALGQARHARIEACIRASLALARQQPESVMPFVTALARELDEATLAQHITAYVNAFSDEMGPLGLAALHQLQTFRDFA